MKTIYKSICAISVIFGLLSCSDKNESQVLSRSEKVETVELARINTFYDLSIPGNADWQVERFPEWAVPMQNTGSAGTVLQLFVETNFDEADRSDTLSVKAADGSTYNFFLTQMGTLLDPDNGAALSFGDVSLTCGVGYSLNVLDDASTSLFKYNIKASSPINFAKLFNALGESQLDEQDAFFSDSRYSSRTENIVGSSTSDIASQLAVGGNIEVGLDAFKATVNGSYSSVSVSGQKYMYAMQEIQHIVRSRYLRSGLLVQLAGEGNDIFQTKFKKSIESLKKNPNDLKAIKSIVATYGTHIITYAALGGELRVSMQMKVTDDTKDSDIHGALDLSSKVVNATGDFTMNNKEKNIAKNTSVSFKSIGGNNVYSIAPGATFETFMTTLKDKNKMTAWVEGIQNEESLAVIDIETIPIYDLMPTAESRDAMRNYIVGDYQREKYGADYKPSLYKVTGYDVTDVADGNAALTLEDINQTIEVERSIVAEISDTDYSTLVYSGVIGKLNRNVAFFVGSDKRKPAKIHFDDNGNVISVEELTVLPVGAVTELYIDTTGDVTLMPKGYSNLYQTIAMDWK